MKNMWMVRAGRNAVLIDEFKKRNIVALGWGLGNLKDKSAEDIKRLMADKYPNKSKSSLSNASAQVIKFRYEIKKGDYVISYNPSSRKYLIGKVISDYYFSRAMEKDGADYTDGHNDTRDVKWLGEVSRDNLSISTKKTLGALSTLFKINNNAEEDILNNLNNNESKIKENEDVLF